MIGQKFENGTTKNITNNEKAKVAVIRLNPWKPFPKPVIKDIKIDQNGLSGLDIEYVDPDYDEEVQAATKEVYLLSSEATDVISITSIAIGILAFIGVIASITAIYKTASWQMNTNSASELTDIETGAQVLSLEKRILKLEMELVTNEKNLFEKIGNNLDSLKDDIIIIDKKIENITDIEDFIRQKIDEQRKDFADKINDLITRVETLEL